MQFFQRYNVALKINFRGALNLMFIDVENPHSDPSLNSRRGCFYFPCHQKKYESNKFSFS